MQSIDIAPDEKECMMQAAMDRTPTTRRLIQAQAHAEANSLPTTLKLWRDGVMVEMWRDGRRLEHRVTWWAIETDPANPIIAAIDGCHADLVAEA